MMSIDKEIEESDGIALMLPMSQFKYVAQCVAYGVNFFPPWPDREKQTENYVCLFNLRLNKYGTYEEYDYNCDDEDTDE